MQDENNELDIDWRDIKKVEKVEKTVFCFECLKKFKKELLVEKSSWHYKGCPVSRNVFVCSDCEKRFGKTLGRV